MINRDLLHRMKSIRQTVQISGAQKLLAASQIGKAKKLLDQSLPYHNNVSRTFADVMLHAPKHSSRYIETDRTRLKRRGLMVFSANRGLAGGFNSNIVRFTEEEILKHPADYMIVLGKAKARFLQNGLPVDEDYDQPLDPPTMFTARELAEKITGMLDQNKIDSFDIIFTAYRSSVKLEVVKRRLFPLNPQIFIDEFGGDSGVSDCIFEPDPERVIASIALKYLKGYLYGCLVHTWICELTSRVMAMDNAIRNGNEMLDALSLAYNRGRQSAITQEITEIVAGALSIARE
jgi:F-type H+-transporting ATPase subunit gamma